MFIVCGIERPTSEVTRHIRVRHGACRRAGAPGDLPVRCGGPSRGVALGGHPKATHFRRMSDGLHGRPHGLREDGAFRQDRRSRPETGGGLLYPPNGTRGDGLVHRDAPGDDWVGNPHPRTVWTSTALRRQRPVAASTRPIAKSVKWSN